MASQSRQTKKGRVNDNVLFFDLVGVVWIRWRYYQDRNRFLEILAETGARTRWQVLAWCLMRNHFHLVVEKSEPNLVAGMKWLLEQANARPGPGHFGELVQELFAL